jgi:ribosomal protein S18 acetylase RimI-like enzyme
MCAIQIRDAGPDDAPFLVSMLVETVNFAPDRQQDPLGVLADPQLVSYIADWPRDRDRGLIATNDRGSPIGACWLRYRSASDPGYGFVAPDIPELTIGLGRQARGQGIGRALLRAIAAQARAEGVTTLSLSVEHANLIAALLYRSEGWRLFKHGSDADTLVLDLSQGRPQHPPLV